MSGSRHAIGSDLAKVDMYRNTTVDYDEIPEGTDKDFARAIVNKGGVPMRGRPALGDRAKKQVTLRLDPHVVSYFRETGDGWQSRINRFLGTSEMVLRMIHEQEGLIKDMETMIGSFQAGEIRLVFEARDKTIERVEQNIRNAKETVFGLKEQIDFGSTR